MTTETNHADLAEDTQVFKEAPLPMSWEDRMLAKQYDIVSAGAPIGVLAKSTVEVMPVRPDPAD